jgi:hypothetical protein
LTNTGTWLIGKLQAERDKDKVIEGLRGAIVQSGGAGGETNYDLLINKLSSRVFLMHNINQGSPQVITSRWAMSYLRGPLTKPQISELMKTRQSLRSFDKPAPILTQNVDLSANPPSIDPKITQVYINDAVIGGEQGSAFNQSTPIRDSGGLIYEPRLMAKTTIGYYDKKLGVDRQVTDVLLLTPSDEVGSSWDKAQRIAADKIRYSISPGGPANYRSVPTQISTSEKVQGYGRSLIDYMLLNSRLRILSHKELNITQQQGEDERAFAIRLRDAARELRDSEVRKIQDDYEEKISKLETKMSSLERSLSSDQQEVQARKREEYLGAGATVLGFFIGRKNLSGITSTSRRMRMTQKAQNDVQEKQGKLSDLKKDSDELEAELKEAVDKITRKWEDVSNEVSVLELRPSRGNIKVDLLALAWVPT